MRTLAIVSILLASLLGCSDSMAPREAGQAVDPQSGAVTLRSMDEFVAAQGTYCLDDGMGGCFLFVPPLDNFLGWSDPSSGMVAAVDYAGIANRWLEDSSGGSISFGTVITGSVVERPMDDGRAHVHVDMHVKNALTWVAADFDFNGPLLFGARAPEVLADGDTPALGTARLGWEFVNTAPGAPLPDLMQILFDPEPGQEIHGASIVLNTAGPLREAFGEGEGTPGRVRITEVGLLGLPAGGLGVGDGFPVEAVRLQPVGTTGGGPGPAIY